MSSKEGEKKAAGELSAGQHLGTRILLFWVSIILPLIVAIYIVVAFGVNSVDCTKRLLLVLLAFHLLFYCVLIFNSALAKRENILRLSKGEMRRSIAIILTIAFISTLFLDLANIVETTGQYTLYFAYGVYGAIMSFYFGSRVYERKKIEEAIKGGNVAEILKMRYATGDLSEEEFRMKERQLKIESK